MTTGTTTTKIEITIDRKPSVIGGYVAPRTDDMNAKFSELMRMQVEEATRKIMADWPSISGVTVSLSES